MLIEYAGDIVDGVDSDGNVVAIQEGESCNVIGTFHDGLSAIQKSALITVTASLFVRSTGASINSRLDQDILDDNGGTITDAGVLTLRLNADDNVVVGNASPRCFEQHVVRVEWTWSDGVEVRDGKQEVLLHVQKLMPIT